MSRILVTGSEGLVGTAVVRTLAARGHAVARFDTRCPAPGYGDVRDAESVRAGAAGCQGIVHLAAVARVGCGEADPDLCWQTNVTGTENVVRAAAASPVRPWVLLVSSREVYGEPAHLPVHEASPVQPVNVYGRSKAAAEQIVATARDGGLRVAIVRLANVYGHPDDYPDRVVPAFARAAAEGGTMEVRGRDGVLDFVHVDDAARGIVALVEALEAGGRALPPVHLVSGHAVSLGELAEIANRAGGRRATVVDAPERASTVARFVGDPSRARDLLRWRAEIGIDEGVRRLVEAFQARRSLSPEAPPRADGVERPGRAPVPGAR